MEKIIHQIWVGPYPMPARERSFVERTRKDHPDYIHHLWTDKNIPDLPEPVAAQMRWRGARKDYAFQADVLRVWLIHEFGGTYIDVDTEPLEGMNSMPISSIDGWFYHNEPTDFTIPNGAFGLKKGHPLAKFLLNRMVLPAYDFGPAWLGGAVREYLKVHRRTAHIDVGSYLSGFNIAYLAAHAGHRYAADQDWWQRRFYHHALYSWSDENKKLFSEGKMP